MRRAYIEVHETLAEAFAIATNWGASDDLSVISHSTAAIEDSPWLERSGLPIGVTSGRHSRFTARPQGTVIAWELNLEEVIAVEGRAALTGLVVVRAYDEHAPWTTAHEAEHLGGRPIPRVPEASSAVKALVRGIGSQPAVRNQGLVDSRERSTAVEAMTYFRDHGHAVDPNQLVVEAIRTGWPGSSPLELARLAEDLNDGKRLRFQRGRLRAEVLAEWASA